MALEPQRGRRAEKRPNFSIIRRSPNLIIKKHILPIITHKQIISMKAKKPSKFEILTLLDYQQLASQLLPPEFYTYFISGSDE